LIKKHYRKDTKGREEFEKLIDDYLEKLDLLKKSYKQKFNLSNRTLLLKILKILKIQMRGVNFNL